MEGEIIFVTLSFGLKEGQEIEEGKLINGHWILELDDGKVFGT